MTKMRLNGTQIINARLDRGLSQAQLAARIEVSIPTICRAERSGGIHPATAQALCVELNLDLAATRIPVEDQKPKNPDVPVDIPESATSEALLS